MERSLRALFDHAQSIEMSAAGIYKDFSFRFGHIEDVSRFWSDLGDDEVKHAEILKETKLSIPCERLDGDADPTMWYNVSAVLQKLNRIEQQKIKNLDDAYEAAHSIESSEIEAIFRFLTLDCFSTSIREAFIVSEITEHQKKLTEFGLRYGPKSVRESIISK